MTKIACSMLALVMTAAPAALAQGAAKPAEPAKPAAGKPAEAAKPAAPAAAPAKDGKDMKAGEMKGGDMKAGAPMGPPPPAAELAAGLKALEGKWKCAGEQKQTDFGPAHPVKATMTTKSDLGGHWYMMRYEEQKSKDSPNPYMMNATIGFDPTKKQFVRTDLDNTGSFYHATSTGWSGDKMVFTGELLAGGRKVPLRDTLTKKSDKEIVTLVELGGKDGAWTTLVEQTCKK